MNINALERLTPQIYVNLDSKHPSNFAASTFQKKIRSVPGRSSARIIIVTRLDLERVAISRSTKKVNSDSTQDFQQGLVGGAGDDCGAVAGELMQHGLGAR